jgi:hypothetical protein
LFVSKDTADTLVVVAKAEAKVVNPTNPYAPPSITTIEATIASVASGVVTGVVSLDCPYPAIKIVKTGTAGIATVIAVA